MINRKVKLAVIVTAICLLNACTPKNLPPELKPAFQANQVLQRVDELQKLTISLFDSKPPQISKERADMIVKFTIVAAEAAHKSISGWQATIKAAWKQLNQQLLVPEKELATVWNLVDAVIGAL